MKECDEIEKEFARNRNLMVSKKRCQFCNGSRDILSRKKIDFLEINHMENETFSREIAEKYGHTTYQKAFLDTKLIGEMLELKEYVNTKEFRDIF